MNERARRHGVTTVIGCALRGPRTVHQVDRARPRCPHCAARLRPGRVLSGWEPGARRRTHYCLTCDGGWCVVDDPGELVDALTAYWLARTGRGASVPAATARLAALSLEIPAPPG